MLKADFAMRIWRTHSRMREKIDCVMTVLGPVDAAIPMMQTSSKLLEHDRASMSPLVELVNRPPAVSLRTTTKTGMEDPVEEVATALVNKMKGA